MTNSAVVVNPHGDVGVGTQSPGARLEVDGGLRLNATAAQPACSPATRGTFWVVQGGAGVKDAVQACLKDAQNLYAWRAIY